MKTLTTHVAAALTLAMMAGCGTQGSLAPVGNQAAPAMGASGYTHLKGAFKRIHKAIFTSMDADANGWLDEYEVSKHMSLKDFQKADTASGWGSAGRLSRTEFVNWSTKKFLWFKDDEKAFADRFRKDLGKAFNRLDEDRDGLLEKNETSLRDLARLRLTFEYDKLNVEVPIKKISLETFTAADKTGDSMLSPAEFEDLYIEMVIEALGGEGGTPAGL